MFLAQDLDDSTIASLLQVCRKIVLNAHTPALWALSCIKCNGNFVIELAVPNVRYRPSGHALLQRMSPLLTQLVRCTLLILTQRGRGF